MAATKRQEQKAATRAKVVEAARVLFTTEGYDSVGIRDVARVASMSTGAIFSSFKDKRELYEAAMGPIPEAVARFLYGPGAA